jgi:hypothetical protein
MPVDGLYQEAAPEPLVQAVAANSPASASDKLYVVVPSFDPAAKWGPVVWTPRGSTLPTAGSLCLLARDDQGLWWVVAWSGAWTGGGPPSGSAGGDLTGSYPDPTFSTAGLAKMLQPANDLSDVASKPTSVTNLGAAFGGLGYAAYAGAGNALTNALPGPWAITAAIPFTVVNPNGAYVRVCGGLSAYASAVGTIVDIYWQLDAQITWQVASNHVGRYYFNTTSDHRWLGSFDVPIGAIAGGKMAAGSHTILLAVANSGGNITRDANDWCQLAAYELP